MAWDLRWVWTLWISSTWFPLLSGSLGTGYAYAWIRRGKEVEQLELSLRDIYTLAAEKFSVNKNDIAIVDY